MAAEEPKTRPEEKKPPKELTEFWRDFECQFNGYRESMERWNKLRESQPEPTSPEYARWQEDFAHHTQQKEAWLNLIADELAKYLRKHPSTKDQLKELLLSRFEAAFHDAAPYLHAVCDRTNQRLRQLLAQEKQSSTLPLLPP
jgi:hypothetical protein